MTLALDPDDPRSPALQIAEALRRGIRDGVYAPGERLPSVAELKTRFGVATGTVQSALRTLREEGLITSWQGRGSYVRTVESPPATAADISTLVKTVEQLVDRVRGLTERIEDLEALSRSQGQDVE